MASDAAAGSEIPTLFTPMNPADPAHPEFLPDPALSRDEMEALQRGLGETATFEDDFSFDPGTVCVHETVQTTLDVPNSEPNSGQPDDHSSQREDHSSQREDHSSQREDHSSQREDHSSQPDDHSSQPEDSPLVAGVDQAFLDDRAVGAVVVLQGDEVVERAHAVTDLAIPYIPGLLAFREGEPILAALSKLSTVPDLLMLDGSGRIHFRQAGIATHVGVLLDVPAVGVAKSLLCGEPAESVEGLPEGTRVPIHADRRVEAPENALIGYAYQSRQFDSPNRHINPLYVSPGHRVGPDTAVDLVAGCCAGYKLPEPTRLADSYADEVKAEHR